MSFRNGRIIPTGCKYLPLPFSFESWKLVWICPLTPGRHQFVVWTALELEGFGCNLQHYNYNPEFHKAVLDTWELPAAWKLKSQLNFGVPTEGPNKTKDFDPIEDRLKVFG